MQQYDQKLKAVITYYFNAETRAGEISVGKVLLVKDRIHLVKELNNLIESGTVSLAYEMGIILAEYETPGIKGIARKAAITRHATRLKKWVKEYNSGTLSLENATSVKSPTSFDLVPDDDALFKRNLIETVKAVCMSALKNGLSDEDIQVILNSGHIVAKEERKIQEVKFEFTKFLRDKGITKDIAMQLLD